ncbi:zinc-ribbon domain-containing protein [Cohnella sp. WQ 127256]|uniref:zinc-ribbon domain-containing protein n=1 Tax=Cohnella sp. WQ 127256 TaxID=2938790 RepID=UPI00211989F7|nr:zinc ribbon domain-containing protein [Cohnella sp. WQ 127256]
MVANFCSSCGNRLNQEDSFCSVCGKKIERIQSPKVNIQTQQEQDDLNNIWNKVSNSDSANRYKYIVIIIGMCIGLFIGSVIGYSLAPASKGSSAHKPTLTELLKNEWKNIGGTVTVTSNTPNNYMAKALSKGRTMLILFGFAGLAGGGLVGGYLVRIRNK